MAFNFGALLGGMSEGFGKGMNIAQQQALLKLKQEAYKQQQEFEKMKLQQLQQAEKDRKREEMAREQLGILLSNNRQPVVNPAAQQQQMRMGSPAASAQAGVVLNPSIQNAFPLAMQGGLAGMQALELATKTGMLPTPEFEMKENAATRKAYMEAMRLQIDMDKEGRASKLDDIRLQNIQSQIEARNLGMEQTALSIRETQGKIAIQVEGRRLRDSFVAKAQGMKEAGNPMGDQILNAIATGNMQEAYNAMYRPYAGMSELEVAQRAMAGDTQAIEALGLKAEMGGKTKDFNIIMGENGIESISYGSGSGKQEKFNKGEAKNFLEEMTGIDYSKRLIGHAKKLIFESKGKNIVGPAATLAQLGSSIAALRQGYTKTEGKLAEKFALDAFTERAADSVRLHATLTILAAYATRNILDESGVLTDQDIRRGQSIVGQKSGFFTGPNTNERVLISLSNLEDTLKLKEASLMERKRLAAEYFTPQRYESSMPFMKRAMERSGTGKPNPKKVEIKKPLSEMTTDELMQLVK